MRRFRFLLLLILAPAFSHAQTPRAELEKRRASILAAIRETQAELATTKQDKRATMGQLRTLQAKLDARQKLIGSINQEMSQIDGSINYSTKEVTTLQQEVETLQRRYAQSIRYAYRNRSSQNMLAFLFSSASFNEGLRRMAYLKKFRDFRMAQADQIRITQGTLNKKIGVLNNEKTRKAVLLTVEEQQRQVLQQEAAEKNNVVKELKGRESELAADVAKNQKAAKNLERAISDAIRREIEIARKKAAEEEARRREVERRRQEEERQRALAAANAAKAAAQPATPAVNGTGSYANGSVKLNTGSGKPNTAPANQPANSPASASRNTAATTPAVTTSTPIVASATTPARRPAMANVPIGLTPEAAALSAGFVSNRGRLPWPVEKGYIVSAYGRHPHPIAEKVIVENSGIDIQTNAGAAARSVFEGTVSKVFSSPDFGFVVLINHGEYFTVYNGLANVSVSAGQQVKTKQSIGTVGPNDEGAHVLKFQVWKGASTQNPASWIAQ